MVQPARRRRRGSGVASVVCCGQKPEGGVEVVACDGDALVHLASANGVLHAKHGGPLAEVRDVGAGHALGRAGELGGEAVGRQPWIQLQPAEVVLEYVGAPAFVGEPHPHHLVEAPWAAQGRIDMLRAVGGGEDEDLAALLDAVEQDQELRDDGHLVLGTLGGARRGNAESISSNRMTAGANF